MGFLLGLITIPLIVILWWNWIQYQHNRNRRLKQQSKNLKVEIDKWTRNFIMDLGKQVQEKQKETNP